MLSMDDIKYIKLFHEKEGLSIREIMRRTGYLFSHSMGSEKDS